MSIVLKLTFWVCEAKESGERATTGCEPFELDWNQSVNFGAKRSPTSPHWCAQIDCIK